MKVLFLTEGGSDIGFGHITRCISICQAFEERGIIPEFIVNGDGVVGELLKGRKYHIFNWLEEKNRVFNIAKDFSVIIIDSYLAGVELYKRMSEIAKIPLYFDDNKRIEYPKGFLVNGTIYAEEQNYPKRKGITYLLGSQYTPLRKEFWEVYEKGIRDEIKSIMVTFGGDDARDMTPRILKFLNEKYPELIKNVIIGRGFGNTNIKKIENSKYKKVSLIYNPDAERMKEIMLESDIAISAGGQTLYELARAGVPAIAIAVADNQLYNTKAWQKAGFIKYAGLYNNGQLFKNIQDCLENLKDYETRKIACDMGRKYLDGAGARRVVKKIRESLA